MKKEWRKHPTIKHVEVSNKGDVRINITPHITMNGYVKANLLKRNSEYVHRLVAETFLKGRKKELEINHIDGNKQNNCVNNLEFCTHKENVSHSFKALGRNFKNRLPRKPNVTKNVAQEVYKMYHVYGFSVTELSYLYNIRESVVRVIVKSTSTESKIKSIKSIDRTLTI